VTPSMPRAKRARAGNKQGGTIRHRKIIQELSFPKIASTDRMT
jgi:hypothetical protein